MRHRGPVLAISALILSITVMVGCGGNASPTRTAPPSSPTPPSTSGTTQWQVVLHGINGHAGISGSVTVTTTGDVTLQFTGTPANTTYTLQFCGVVLTAINATCVSLPTVISDASGAGQVIFHFPKSGTWAGDFEGFTSSASSPAFATVAETASAFNSSVMQVVPATTANGTGIDGGHPQDAGSGTMSVTNGVAHVALTGAPPNKVYSVFSCFSGASSCQNASSITTDASGNATGDAVLSSPGVGIVGIRETTGFVMFVGGFKVP